MTRSLILAAAVLVLASCGSESETKPPSSCLRALDAAEVVHAQAERGFQLVNSVLSAVLDGDVVNAVEANSQLEDLSNTVGTDVENYTRLAEECRAHD